MQNNKKHQQWLFENMQAISSTLSGNMNNDFPSRWITYKNFFNLNWADAQKFHPIFGLMKKLSGMEFEPYGNDKCGASDYIPSRNDRGIYRRTHQHANNLIHEPCHWLVATKEQRRTINFGLGDAVLGRKEFQKWQIIKEAEASLLNILFYRWFKIEILLLGYPVFEISHGVSAIHDREFFNIGYTKNNAEAIIREKYATRLYVEGDSEQGWKYFTEAKENLINRDFIKEYNVNFYNRNHAFLMLNPKAFDLDYSHEI